MALKENYCLNDDGTAVLAKAPEVAAVEYMFVSDMTAHLLETYVGVYREAGGSLRTGTRPTVNFLLLLLRASV